MFEQQFFAAFKKYCGKSKFKSTLHGFANNGDYHKELITTWFEIYATYDDAMSNLLRKFKTAYYISKKTNYTSKTVPDLSSLFAQAQLQKSITKNGAEALNESVNTTTKKIMLRLKLPPQV